MAGPVQPVVIRAEERPRESWDDPVRGSVAWHTLFSSDISPTEAMTAGIAVVEAGGGSLEPHRHAQPELYYILDGTGLLSLEGAVRTVRAGDAVFIPGDAAHALRNAGEVPLRLLYVFPTDSFADVVYRFD